MNTIARSRIAVAVLLLLLIAGSVAWYSLGGHPQHWDSAIHISESLNANRIGEDTSRTLLHRALNVSWYYPPFVSYASVLVYKLLGDGAFASLQVMTLFLCVLVLSVYGMGKELFGEREGLIAAVFTASFPAVLRYSHTFMLDLPLGAMVALSIYLLIRTDIFARLYPSILLGCSLGAGMLTKWTFPFFVLLPFLYEGYSALTFSDGRLRRMVHCLLSLAVGGLIAAPWYLVHAIQIVSSRSGELGRGGEDGAGSFLYYLRILPEQVSWFIIPLVLGGVVVCLVRYRSRSAIPLLSFLGGYMLGSLVTFKTLRFSLPLLGPLAVLASAGCVCWIESEYQSPRVRIALWTALLLIPLTQFLLVSLVPREAPAGERLSRPFLSASIESVDGPFPEDWKQDSITAAINADRIIRAKKRAVVRMIPDHPYFNNATLSYSAKQARYPVTVLGTTGFPLFADYVLVKTGNSGESSGERDRIRTEVMAETSGTAGMYAVVKRWNLPDGSEGVLVRIEPKLLGGISPGSLERQLRKHLDLFIRRYLKPEEGYALDVRNRDSTAILKGEAEIVTVAARRGQLGDFAFNPVGLGVENVLLELEGLRFDPGRLAGEDSLVMLSIDGLHVRSFSCSTSSLARYARESSGGDITVESCSIVGGNLRLEASSRSLEKTFDLTLALHTMGRENIWFSFRDARIGNLPIPAPLMNVMTSPFNPVLTGLDELSDVRIGTLRLEKDRIAVVDSM